MPRRLEIELTSRAQDGSWTWRAAGAKQPRGTLDAALVPPAAAVGTVLRAEIETGLDGIEVTAVAAKAAEAAPSKVERIEVIGVPQRGPDVSVTLAPGSRRRRDGEDRPGRREGGPRGEGAGRRPAGRRPGEGGEGGRDGARRTGDRRPAGASGEGRPPRQGTGEDRGQREGAGRPPRDGASERRAPGGPPKRERERKPAVSTTHRNAMLAELRPEQLPVAEQLLRGGIPAVRQAIDEQNARARGEGQPPADTEPILRMAEELLPAVNLATWKDRASAAQAAGRDLRLRELRAVVAASRTVTVDDEGRVMAKALQDALEQRVTALRDEWVQRLEGALAQGRVLDALRTVARPPEPATRCPAELAVTLAQQAGQAMTAELAPAEWLALLDAVVETPVRRNVHPAGIPDDPAVQAAARNAAGLVPALAKLLGLRIPPPPPRRTVGRPPLTRAGGAGPAAGH